MKTILVIDDDFFILDVLTAYLTRQGYRTLSARDGKSGLEAFASEPVDFVLCDLTMPGMGGLAVLDEVKKLAPLTPFVVFSGSNDVGSAVDAIRRGAWDYLLKPLPGLELLLPLLERLDERATFLREKEAYQSKLEDQIRVRTAQLVRQLREKDLLLAEVHHRVKNNLQVILVLLNWQREHSSDPAVKEALEAHQDRIRALAMVQEEMQDPDHATLINARSYTTSLIHHLLSSHGLTAKLELELDLDDLNVSPSQAFTLGLVLNELVGCLALEGTPTKGWSLSMSLRAGGPGVITLEMTDSRSTWQRIAPTPDRPAGWDLIAALAGTVAWNPEVPETVTVRLT